VPLNDDWLGASEKTFQKNLKFEKRRNDWRLGRWTAKCALAFCLEKSSTLNSLGEIEIIAGKDGAPVPYLNSKPCKYHISISHREGNGFCVISEDQSEIGCDLEIIEPRSLEFISDYFTNDENKLVGTAQLENRPLLANLIWSAKESAMKLLREGLRIDTWSVIVELNDIKEIKLWQPLSVLYAPDERTYHGFWLRREEFVMTLVANPPPEVPFEIKATPR
jgi:4'-phosphopantetheinyl transferase